MKQKLLILGVIVAIAAISAIKSFGPERTTGSCCPGLPPGHETHVPSHGATGDSTAVIPEGRPVWVLAHSDWCAQCQEMSKIASKVVPAFSGKVAFVDLKVDDPAQQELVRNFKVSVIPTSIFVDAAGKEIDRVLGVIPEADLREKLQALAGDQ